MSPATIVLDLKCIFDNVILIMKYSYNRMAYQ